MTRFWAQLGPYCEVAHESTDIIGLKHLLLEILYKTDTLLNAAILGRPAEADYAWLVKLLLSCQLRRLLKEKNECDAVQQ